MVGLTQIGREALSLELVGAYLYLASDGSSFTSGLIFDIKVDGGIALDIHDLVRKPPFCFILLK